MSEPKVLVDIDGSIGRVTINDPAALNALSPEAARLLLDCIVEAEAKARVIVLTGAGRAFCAGANLAGVSLTDERDAGADLEGSFNPVIRYIRDLKVPLVTQVRGAAAGFGASLALAGDLIIASDNSYFLQAFRNIGLVPDGGAAFTLVRSVGRVRAVELMLLGERLPAATALEWGLVTRVVPDAELEVAVESYARNLADGPSVALGRIRQMAWAASETTLQEVLAIEVENQRACGYTRDHKEGVAAFMDKRKAAFRGE